MSTQNNLTFFSRNDKGVIRAASYSLQSKRVAMKAIHIIDWHTSSRLTSQKIFSSYLISVLYKTMYDYKCIHIHVFISEEKKTKGVGVILSVFLLRRHHKFQGASLAFLLYSSIG